MTTDWAREQRVDIVLKKLGIGRQCKLGDLLVPGIRRRIDLGGIKHAVEYFATNPIVRRHLKDPTMKGTIDA